MKEEGDWTIDSVATINVISIALHHDIKISLKVYAMHRT